MGILMKIPAGFSEEIKWKDSKVIRLRKALYGLRASPRRWNERFDKVMKTLNMKRDPAEPCLYY